MIVKATTLFLIVMAVLAMFGKYKFPGQKYLSHRKCPSCGRFKIGTGPCPCQGQGNGRA